MKKTNLLLAVAALTAASCSDNTDITSPIDPSGKEMISFSMSDGSALPITRAGLHTTSSTDVVMRIMSQKGVSGTDKKYARTKVTASIEKKNTSDNTTYSDITIDDLYKLYWDDCFGRDAFLSVYAVAVPGKSITSDSKLQESSLTAGDGSSSAKWGTNDTNTITWSVSHKDSDGDHEQVDATLTGEDLTYSRNIRENGTDGRYVWSYTDPVGYPAETGNTTHSNGRMQFVLPDGAQSTDAGHFDKGHLVFTHSLSRITLTLISGKGFNDTDDSQSTHDFNLSSAGIAFNGMNVQADLNLTDGTWGTKTTGTIIAKPTIGSTTVNIDGSDVTKACYKATVQMLPDYDFGETSTTNVISFTIDDNTYYVDQKMIYAALKDVQGVTAADSKIRMQQQTNYHLNITINKTGIELVTATLQPWTEVYAADKQLYNSYVTIDVSSANGACEDFDIYRLGDGDGNIYTNLTTTTADSKTFYTWFGDYTDKASSLTKLSASDVKDGKFKTNWFFEDNKTFYHFRTVNKSTVIKTYNDTNSNSTKDSGEECDDYFEIVSGNQADHDYHWGAPMEKNANFKYTPTADSTDPHASTATETKSSEGYSSSIYKAIGSTENEIKITELHMMSNINIILETTAADAGDHVNLSNAKVYLTKFYTEGQVKMGSGLVTPTTTSLATTDVLITPPSSTDYWTSNDVKTKPFTYAVVPQLLSRGTGAGNYVGVTIVTSDNNQYYVIEDLSKIYATSIKQEGSDASYNDPDHPNTATSSSTDAQKTAAAITRWYPNHSYTYTFKITKKGIDNITCTLAPWVNVYGENIKIDLEN